MQDQDSAEIYWLFYCRWHYGSETQTAANCKECCSGFVRYLSVALLYSAADANENLNAWRMSLQYITLLQPRISDRLVIMKLSNAVKEIHRRINNAFWNRRDGRTTVQARPEWAIRGYVREGGGTVQSPAELNGGIGSEPMHNKDCPVTAYKPIIHGWTEYNEHGNKDNVRHMTTVHIHDASTPSVLKPSPHRHSLIYLLLIAGLTFILIIVNMNHAMSLKQ